MELLIRIAKNTATLHSTDQAQEQTRTRLEHLDEVIANNFNVDMLELATRLEQLKAQQIVLFKTFNTQNELSFFNLHMKIEMLSEKSNLINKLARVLTFPDCFFILEVYCEEIVMKMSKESFEYIKERVLAVSGPDIWETYKARGLCPKRYRWDMIYNSGLSGFMCKLYNIEDLDDDHIDTALRSILGAHYEN